MFLVFQLLRRLWLECLPTFHLDKWLLCIHMLCINKVFPILCHHMFLHLMLGISTQYLQWVPSNSGRTSRSWHFFCSCCYEWVLLVVINNVLFIIFLVFRLHQRVHRYLHRMKSNHPKLTKIQWDQMRTTTMKFLSMDKLYVKTIWMFITAMGCLILESHPLGKHRSCEYLFLFW